MLKGDYDDWVESRDGRLALIILSIWIARSVSIDLRKIYENDQLAIDIARIILKRPESRKTYRVIERFFIILALTYSEKQADVSLAIK